MKKLIFCASAALVMLASCGKSEVCDCVDTRVSELKERKESNGDKEKMKAVREKYKVENEKCEKIVEKLAKGKSEADLKKLDEELKKCAGWAEMEKLRQEK
jgi:hypothetical protein